MYWEYWYTTHNKTSIRVLSQIVRWPSFIIDTELDKAQKIVELLQTIKPRTPLSFGTNTVHYVVLSFNSYIKL